MKTRFWLLALPLLLAAPAQAQQTSTAQVVAACGAASLPTTVPSWIQMDPTGALCTSAVLSGSITANSAAIAAAALPSLSAGARALYQSLSGGQYVQPIIGTQIVDATHGIPVVAQTGATWATTIIDGGDVTLGALADAAATAGSTGTVSAKLRLMTTQLGTINTTLGTPFQAGGSIGNTSFGISGTLPAFAAIPTVKIDQTTPGTTNAVQANAGTNLNTSLLALESGNLASILTALNLSAVGITPVVSAAAESSHVIKASAGNVYSAYATNLTSTAGFLVLINATSAPVDGAITPLACALLSPNGVASINYAPGPPGIFSTGITAVVTSAATCFTKTTGVITAFISGSAK